MLPVDQRLNKAKLDTVAAIDAAKPLFDVIRYLLTFAAVLAVDFACFKNAIEGKKPVANTLAGVVVALVLVACYRKLTTILYWASYVWSVPVLQWLGLYDLMSSDKAKKARIMHIFVWCELVAMNVISYLAAIALLNSFPH